MKIHDPIEAFLLGVLSGPLRTLFGFMVIFGAYALCYAVGGGYSSGNVDDVFVAILAVLGMILHWGTYGVWFVLGMTACLAMWGGLFAFVVADSPKLWLYVLTTGAVVYFAPVAAGGPWQWAAIGYLVLTLAYWRLPALIAKRRGATNNQMQAISARAEKPDL